MSVWRRKERVAASYFNRATQKQSLLSVAIAVAAEKPYLAVFPKAASFLEADGFDVRKFRPLHVTASDLSAATRVVSIDCDLTKLDSGGVAIDR